jgi:hypothetical protein
MMAVLMASASQSVIPRDGASWRLS